MGDFNNASREWQPRGHPDEIRLYYLIDSELGIVTPYGIPALTTSQGWVSVGIDHDAAEFALESTHRWWWKMGRPLYPKAQRVLVTADCGGSNGYRVRLWRV